MNAAEEVSMSASIQPSWRQAVAPYRHPILWRSLWQLANTLIPYFALWYLMVLSLQVSYWLTLALAIPASGLLVRIFVLFHDCCHGSFFRSARANAVVGFVLGVLTFTPYYQWRHDHAIHHATAANLDRRGVGDIWTLTVKEYQALPPLKRLAYRLFRHPLIMFGLGPLYSFVISQRLPRPGMGRRERHSIWWTNLALLVIVTAAALTIGLKAYLLIQGPIILLGGAAGVWLFYIQHQFEGVYWERQDKWSFEMAALKGSSYYKLPAILCWFTADIGLHHIHHLNPRIPNYLLQKCYDENPIFQTVKPVTLVSSLKSLKFRLWDEDHQRLIGFRELKAMEAA
jgi:omega-6 fatty acid desaturase (delta-12 desaturase)